MAATKITFHQDYFANHESAIIHHPDGATVQVCGVVEAAGGANRPYVVEYVVIGPDDSNTEPPTNAPAHISRVRTNG